MKNKYDSSVVFLYAIGREDLLPAEFKKKIPYSTISTWRKTDFSKYKGHEYRYYFNEAFKSFETQNENKRLRKLLLSLARSWITLSHLLLPPVKEAEDNKEAQAKILKAIDHLKSQIGLDRTLRLLRISKSLYYQWILQARFDCFDSYTQLCVKRHPQQLHINEIIKIKELLTSPETDHWPINSVQGYALREKQLVASLYSWYKYARLWGIRKKVPKKRQKKVGLQANLPNEYLHVDTTFYPLIDGKRICISFVMDNYSKMILGFSVSDRNTFEIVKKSVRAALRVIETHPNQVNINLVADGGKENHNQHMDAFIKRQSKHKIKKIWALKDIRFSNSPVEAVHRTIKSRYLRGRQFESIRAIERYLKWAVEDYNVIRPHYKHKPRTPYEVYFNIPLGFDIRKRVMEAVQKRVKNNKCAACIQCSKACK